MCHVQLSLMISFFMSKRCDTEDQANSYFRGGSEERRRRNIGLSSAYRRMFCQTRDTFLIIGGSPAHVAKSLCHSRCVSLTPPRGKRTKFRSSRSIQPLYCDSVCTTFNLLNGPFPPSFIFLFHSVRSRSETRRRAHVRPLTRGILFFSGPKYC